MIPTTGGTTTGPTDMSQYYETESAEGTFIEGAFDELFEEKKKPPKKTKQDWKHKNKKNLPKWMK